MDAEEVEWGGDPRAPTPGEIEFATALAALCPALDYWLHEDDDGSPWLLVSWDLVVEDSVRDTLRLDFDPAGIKGGWSPAALNWDSGVRAEAAAVDLTPPDGMHQPADQPPAALAAIAAAWFSGHRLQWLAARDR